MRGRRRDLSMRNLPASRWGCLGRGNGSLGLRFRISGRSGGGIGGIGGDPGRGLRRRIRRLESVSLDRWGRGRSREVGRGGRSRRLEHRAGELGGYTAGRGGIEM